MYTENKYGLRKRLTEGNIWTSTIMPALYVDFLRCPCVSCTCWPVSILYLTSTASVAAAPIQLQKHSSTIRISYIILEHPLKNVIEPQAVISWDSAATKAWLWHFFYVLFFFSTTVSAACCLPAASLGRSLLWKTSNLTANCSKSKLALTVPLGSIHLKPCCFVKRDM